MNETYMPVHFLDTARLHNAMDMNACTVVTMVMNVCTVVTMVMNACTVVTMVMNVSMNNGHECINDQWS